MSELEKNNIINNFQEYINSTNNEDILINLMNDVELCKTIIDNNLFWKNIKIIANKDKYLNFPFEFLKLLIVRDFDNKLISEDMYNLFKYYIGNEETYNRFFNFINSQQRINKDKLYNLFETILKKNILDINYEYIQTLYQTGYKDIISNNFYYILNNVDQVFELKDIIKDDEQLLSKFNSYINVNPSKLIYEMLTNGFKKDLNEIKGEKIFDTIKIIIDELLRNEDKQYSDIEILGEGATAVVFSIGDKVIKIGEKRSYFNIDNNKRFLKPLLRTEIDSINSNENLGCIEITEKASTKNISNKDAYLLYSELRDQGYYWIDCNEANIGRLIKKNKVYFDNLIPVKEAINYKTENTEELDKDELVIIDNDYILSEDEFNNLSLNTRQNYLRSVEEYENEYSSKKR